MDGSLEDKRLLNPAFFGLLVARASQGYIKEASTGLPFAYSFLVAPLVLHPETRERLPHAVVTKLATWAERNWDLLAHVPRRLVELAPATREGVFAAATHGLITISDDTRIVPIVGGSALKKFETESSSQELTECGSRAYFVGRWLATSGTTTTVFTSLGVVP